MRRLLQKWIYGKCPSCGGALSPVPRWLKLACSKCHFTRAMLVLVILATLVAPVLTPATNVLAQTNTELWVYTYHNASASILALADPNEIDGFIWGATRINTSYEMVMIPGHSESNLDLVIAAADNISKPVRLQIFSEWDTTYATNIVTDTSVGGAQDLFITSLNTWLVAHPDLDGIEFDLEFDEQFNTAAEVTAYGAFITAVYDNITGSGYKIGVTGSWRYPSLPSSVASKIEYYSPMGYDLDAGTGGSASWLTTRYGTLSAIQTIVERYHTTQATGAGGFEYSKIGFGITLSLYDGDGAWSGLGYDDVVNAGGTYYLGNTWGEYTFNGLTLMQSKAAWAASTGLKQIFFYYWPNYDAVNEVESAITGARAEIGSPAPPPPDPGPVTLSSIAITPTTASVSVGSTQQFTATGTYSDNSTANLTLVVNWATSNPVAATISSSGIATGIAGGGSTTITAGYGGVTSNSATLTVSAATTTPAALPTPTSTTNETTATVKSFNVYNSLLEPNDYLLVVYANIPYDPIPEDLISETVIWRLFDSTNTNEYGYSYMYAYHDNGYGYNVVGFYFDNSTAPTWGESSYVRLQGNPAFFSEPPNFAWQLEASNYTSETTQELNRAALAALIIDISADIAQRWDIAASTFLMEGETATVLSAAGQQFWRGAIYGLQGLCPNVFPYNLEMVDVDEGERTWETTYAASLSSQWAGTWVEDAQTAGATLFDLDYDLASIILVFVMAAGVLVGNIFLSADTWGGLSDAAIVLVGTARLGLYDLAWLGMIAAICVVYIAIRVWGIGR